MSMQNVIKNDSLFNFMHILEFQEEDFISYCLNPRPVSVDSFKLHDRAFHVYSEANRVLTFKQVCEENKSNSLEVWSTHCPETYSNDFCTTILAQSLSEFWIVFLASK